jgi:hypothetical protein
MNSRIYEDDAYCLGVDIGLSVDPTAMCAMRHRKFVEVTVRGEETFIREEFQVIGLRRLPLGISYVEQMEAVALALHAAPLNNCPLIMDDTGVGRGVTEIAERIGLRPIKVTITSGEKAEPKGKRQWSVPKQVLISPLNGRLHTKELKFSSQLSEAGAMADEMRNFRQKVSEAGRATYAARVNRHDDLVLSVALALWHFVGRPKYPPARVGHYGGASAVNFNQ